MSINQFIKKSSVNYLLIALLMTTQTHASTVDKLNIVKNNGKQQLSRVVAGAIIAHWHPNEINRTGAIGFWWHQRHDRRVLGIGYSGKADRVYVHANSNPLSQPHGPWQIGVSFPEHRPSKHLVVDDFASAGFVVTKTMVLMKDLETKV